MGRHLSPNRNNKGGGTFSRFAITPRAEPTLRSDAALPKHNAALIKGHTVYTSRTFSAKDRDRVLVSGHSNAKIGASDALDGPGCVVVGVCHVRCSSVTVRSWGTGPGRVASGRDTGTARPTPKHRLMSIMLKIRTFSQGTFPIPPR